MLATHGDAAAYSGRFADVLTEAIDSFVENDEDIPLVSLLQEVAWRLGPDADLRLIRLGREPRVRNPRNLGARITASLDVRDELLRVIAGLPAALRAHFLPKAQGSELNELAWYFTGRQDETRRLAAWLHSARDGLLVVTGPAGSGKSALLGRIVTLADPRLVDALRAAELLGDVASDECPPAGVFDVIIHLSSLTIGDAVAQIGSALLAESAPATAAELLAALAAPSRNSRGAVVLVDALDEARDALQIARDLLRPLARTPGVRLIVGTRRSIREGVDLPRPRDRELLDALGVRESETLALANDPAAVADYVVARLVRTERSPYLGDKPRAAQLGKLVAERNEPFLFARLAASELLQRGPIDSGPGLSRLLSRGHRGLFAAACERLAAESSATHALLRGLAFGLGRGLPRADRVWATIAESLADTEIDAGAIDAALRTASAYIVLDGEDGQSTYRLAHKTFAEHFGAGTAGDQAAFHHAQITRALLDVASGTGWHVANPYLEKRLPEHASRGGQLEELLGNSEAVDHVDQRRLSAELARHYLGRGAAPAVADAVMRRREELETLEPEERAAARALAQIQAGTPAPIRPKHAPLWPRWSTGTPVFRHITMRGHRHDVNALAFGLIDQRVVLASGGDDGAIWRWDAASGEAFGDPLRGHENWVLAVAFGVIDQRVVLASAGDDRTVRLWDAASGEAIGEPLRGHDRGVRSIAFGALHDQVLIASASTDRTIRLWDADSGEALGEPLRGHQSGVMAVAFGVLDGRPILASASTDRTVRLWDVATGGAIGEPLTGHGAAVRSVAFGAVRGRRVLATAGDDRTVRLWDVPTGRAIGEPLCGHKSWLRAVTFGVVGDRPVFASAGDDRDVRLWDAATGDAIGEPLRGHDGSVFSVEFVVVEGRVVLASASGDRTVRLWDAASGGAIGEPLSGHEGAVRSVALGTVAGRAVLASGGDDQVVRLWDAVSGAAIGAPLTGHEGTVRSLAFGLVDGRPLLASGGDDQVVRLWDAVSGAAIGAPLTGHEGTVRSLAFGLVNGRPLLASGDGQAVRLWDPASGAETGDPWGVHRRTEVSVAFGVVDGRLLIARRGQAHAVILWDPVGSRAIRMLRRRRNAVRHDSGVRTPSRETHALLRGHASWLQTVACGATEGRIVVASAGTDGIIRLWDAASGAMIGRAFGEHRQPVASLALGDLHGQPVLAAAHVDGAVTLWDTASGELISRLVRHGRRVSRLAFGHIGDEVVLATVGDDNTVGVVDPVSGEVHRVSVNGFGQEFDGDGVHHVALGALGGRTIVAIADLGGTITLWDPARREMVAAPFRESHGRVRAMAFGVLNSRAVLITAGVHGRVEVWDPGCGKPIGSPYPRRGDFDIIAVGVLADRVVLVAGHAERSTTGLWDPTSGEALGAPQSVHDWDATAVGHTGGRVVLASQSRVTEPLGHSFRWERLVGPFRGYDAFAEHWRPASTWPAITLSDPVSGEVIGRPMRNHGAAVGPLAFGAAQGRVVLASASDQRVCLWDPISGDAIAPPFAAFARVNALAMHDGTLVAATSSGLVVLDVKSSDERDGARLGPRAEPPASDVTARRTITLREPTLRDSERPSDEQGDTLGARTILANDAIRQFAWELSESERLRGVDNPDTLRAKANLATAYWSAGRSADAIELLERVLADSDRLLGGQHPDTLSARANLATSYWSAGRFDVISLDERVLSDYERLLGSEHPDTLSVRENLATSYWSAGRAEEAISLDKRVLVDSERLLGGEHPDTLRSWANLAIGYHEIGRTTDAIRLLEQLLVDSAQLLGKQHPETLTVQARLADFYWSAGRTTDAIPMLEHVLAETARRLGSEHPETIQLRVNLSVCYQLAGRTNDPHGAGHRSMDSDATD